MWSRLNARYRRVLIFGFLSVSIYWFLLRKPHTSISNTLLKTFINRTDGSRIEGEKETGRYYRQKFKSRVIAIGDLHGDLPHAVRVLRLAGLIDLRNKWIGSKSILVQTGDIVDRGKDTILLYQLMGRLRTEARAAGGAVINLLGNHEYMNALNDWRYVTKEDIASFGGPESRRRIISSNGWIGQDWLTNYSVTARVPSAVGFNRLRSNFGTNSSSNEASVLDSDGEEAGPLKSAASGFVHGGITPEYAKMGIKEINRIGHSLLNKALSSALPIHHLPVDVLPEESEFYSERGPLWDRSFALEDDLSLICHQIDRTLELLNIRRLIMGHTPQFRGITSRCDGKILLIDTGISSAYGGPLTALEIVYTLNPTAIKSGSTTTPNDLIQSFQEVEIVYALQETKLRKVLSHHERTIDLNVSNLSRKQAK